MELTIRPEAAPDFDEIGEVTKLAFDGREQEAALVAALRGTPGYRPELALVAQQDGQVAGHVMATEVALLRDGLHSCNVLDLAPVSVHPKHQRSGLGSLLIEAVLSTADGAGEPLVVVLGDPRFYKRFGFEAAEHAGIAAPPELPPAALQIRRLSGYRPDVKGTIQFPPVFAATGTL